MMPKVIPYKRRNYPQTARTLSFPKVVAMAVIGSFAVGAIASQFINQNVANSAVHKPSAISAKIVTVDGDSKQASKTVSLQATKPNTTYRHCSGGTRINCIVDGDTLWSNGVKIRVADIDTPEVGTPRCAAEKALGDRATARLIQLVNAGPFQMKAWPGRDEDKYGRKLRVLVRGGQSLGDILVSEGLARTWTGRRQPWC